MPKRQSFTKDLQALETLRLHILELNRVYESFSLGLGCRLLKAANLHDVAEVEVRIERDCAAAMLLKMKPGVD